MSWTPFPDLDAVLDDLRRSARSILGAAYIGLYVQGSFALGAGDAQSDADFIVVIGAKPTSDVERELRRLHKDIPTRPGIGHQNIEGSYADAPALRDASGLGVPWLFNDHGRRTLKWDTHCNTLHTRWILRNHGITLDGPPIRDLVDEVSEAALARAAMADLPGTLEGIAEWADMDNAWTQKYVVQTYSRVLYTARTGRVASKPQALTLGDAVPGSGVAGPAAPGSRRPGPAVAGGRPAAPRQHATCGRVRQVRRSRGHQRVGAGSPLLTATASRWSTASGTEGRAVEADQPSEERGPAAGVRVPLAEARPSESDVPRR